MKTSPRIFLTFIIMVLLFAEACKSPAIKDNTYQLQAAMDSLKKVYAPDSRVKLWISSYENNKLSVLTEDDNAYQKINSVLKNRFSSVEATIELLPKKNRDRMTTAMVNNSVANLRSQPKHSAELATQSLLGTPLRIFKKQGEWYLVQTPNRYIAWVDSAAIVEISSHDLGFYKKSEKMVFTPVSGFSYSLPDKNSQTISDLVMGCILPVSGSKNGYYKVLYPDKREAWVLKSEVTNLNELANQQFNAQKMVTTARKFLGFPYLWGGTSSKAVDCSGFTSTIYMMNGIILQRDASQQTKYGKVITTNYNSKKLLPGDLLFFGRPATATQNERVTHVAMYIGNGEFIHASGKVRINSMDSSQPNFIKSYVPRFVRAVRIENAIDGKGIQLLKDNQFYNELGIKDIQ